jgi:hypothetical protein
MAKLPHITNIYVIAALATIGGLIQGFDVSSLSAIIGTKQVSDMVDLFLLLIGSWYSLVPPVQNLFPESELCEARRHHRKHGWRFTSWVLVRLLGW